MEKANLKVQFLDLVKSLKESGIPYSVIGRRIGNVSLIPNLLNRNRGKVSKDHIEKLISAFPELENSKNNIVAREEFLTLISSLKSQRTSATEVERRIGIRKGFIAQLRHSGKGRVTDEMVIKLKKAFPELDKSNNNLNTKEDFDKKELELLRRIYDLEKLVDQKEALNNKLQQEIDLLKKDMNKS